MENSLYSSAFDYIMNAISAEKIKIEDLEKKISKIVAFMSDDYPNEVVDEEALFRDIMAKYQIWIEPPKSLENNKDHKEWLASEKADIKWSYWRRYEKYLQSVIKLPKHVVSSLDYATDEVLKRIESPRREGRWDRRGMVVGNVQSGKTSNYTGLICKAVDAGYKIIIVLAGLNNDLRSQTQKRLDQGFLGKDTSKKAARDQSIIKIGAGKLVGYEVPPVIAVTSSDANGDYKKNVHSAITITPGGDPVIAVVKKNVTPLKNLLGWFTNENGRIANVPILLIDDEADNASIDTKTSKKIGVAEIEEDDPTAINGYIRKILNSFEQSAYVGYTATPFANIFIYPNSLNEDETEYGEDLYPRSFIVNLHAPNNYMGPEAVFGLTKDMTAGIEEKKPLPLIRTMADYTAFIPEKHKTSLIVTGLPDSLYNAIYAFILSCAARTARGQGDKHKSMLVHITRYVNVQSQIVDILKDAMRNIVNQLEYKTGPKYQKLIADLERLWQKDFVPTCNAVKNSWDDPMMTEMTWSDVEPILYNVAAKIEIKAINGKAADGGLNYEEYPNGLSVIAVGGDKLSRGLTLEGLAVSYYTRTSKMYDTLLQMGRWFGYRPGYADLCRLYTSFELKKWYGHIAVANEELKRELDDMADLGATPEDYGLKVRTHPGGMLITALNKMKNSEKRLVTYSGKLVQVTHYYKKNEVNNNNLKFIDSWIKSLGEESEKPSVLTHGNYLWKDVKPEKVFDFLDNITIHHTCFNASPKILKQYICNQINEKELTEWQIALVSTKSGATENVGGKEIGLSWRTNQESESSDMITLIRENLITESDQETDLSLDQRIKALKDTQANFKPTDKRKTLPTTASPIWIRKNRAKTKALLLIYVFQSGDKEGHTPDGYDNRYVGFAISFPFSDTAAEIEYKVDEVYRRNEFGNDSN